jgi:hypothetical protein
MYPFTKVTWGHDSYERLEAAIRIIEPFLIAFLTTLCSETTFKFQQAYEAELNHKLAELKVEARQQKIAAFSAATETGKALALANNANNESVKTTIDKLQHQISQLQRTQQRQGERFKTNALTNTNNETPPQKNLQGSRGKRGPSAEPPAIIIKERNGGKPSHTQNKRRQPPQKNQKKRKEPSTEETPTADDPATLKKRLKRQQQKQYKRQKLKELKRQQTLKAQNGKQADVQPNGAAATQKRDSSKS